MYPRAPASPHSISLSAGGGLTSTGAGAAVAPLTPATGPHSTLFLIYTSGTTGLPKAATVSHARFFMAGVSFSTMHRLSPGDRVYCPLPLYHSSGGLLGVGMSWWLGAGLVLRRKFSASAFFPDCARYGVTVVQYIGQLARYLLAAPPAQSDRAHRVKKAIGNGMRAEVWARFQVRK